MIEASSAIIDGIETLKRRLLENTVQLTINDIDRIVAAWTAKGEGHVFQRRTPLELTLQRSVTRPLPDSDEVEVESEEVLIQHVVWQVVEASERRDEETHLKTTQLHQRATHWMVAEPWLIREWVGEW